MTDAEEAELGTDPLNSDSDGDGISDGKEVADGSDPLAKDMSDEEKDAASCSSSTTPAGLWPMLLMAIPFFRRSRK